MSGESKKSYNDSTDKYQDLFEHYMDAVYIHDRDGEIVEVNKQACSQSGYSRDELLDLTVFDLHPDIDTAISKDEILNRWREWEEGKRHTFEAKHQRKNGDIYPVQISTGLVSFCNKKCLWLLFETSRSGRRREKN